MKYILLAFLILGFSCRSEQENIEIDVIKSTLLEVIDTLYYKEIPPLPPAKAYLPDSSMLYVESQIGLLIDDQIVINDSLIQLDSIKRSIAQRKSFDSATLAFHTFDWEKYRIDSLEWLKSLDNPLPQKRIVLLVFDSLVSNRRGNIDEVANRGFQKDFEIILEGEYAELVCQLQDSSISPISIDFVEFSSVGKYQIEPENYQTTEKDRIAATLTLSRVVLNSEKTKAAYYYQEHCGFLCGYGCIVFVKRTFNGWKAIGKNMVWIE